MIIRMKIVILFYLFLTLCYGCMPLNHVAISSAPSLVGTWEGISKGDVGGFVFGLDGKADIIKNGDSIRKQTIKDRVSLFYSIDMSKDPMHLDIFGIDTSGKERSRLKMIFQYIDKDSIRVRIGFGGDRPDKFVSDSDKNTIILKRVR
jgi:hypothetical protein